MGKQCRIRFLPTDSSLHLHRSMDSLSKDPSNCKNSAQIIAAKFLPQKCQNNSCRILLYTPFVTMYTFKFAHATQIRPPSWFIPRVASNFRPRRVISFPVWSSTVQSQVATLSPRLFYRGWMHDRDLSSLFVVGRGGFTRLTNRPCVVCSSVSLVPPRRLDGTRASVTPVVRRGREAEAGPNGPSIFGMIAATPVFV